MTKLPESFKIPKWGYCIYCESHIKADRWGYCIYCGEELLEDASLVEVDQRWRR
jgi:hypothetical protein